MDFLQGTRGIRLNTGLGEGALGLRSLRMTERLSELFEMEIDAVSDLADPDLDKLLGANVTVAMDAQFAKEPRYFSAVVIEAELTGARDRRYGVRLRAAPWLWFLTLTQGCRIFQDKSADAIVRTVLEENGFNDFEFRSERTYPTYTYCVQYNETDFNFISRLMEHEGLYYFFEHANGSCKLIVVDGMAQHEPAPDYATFPFHPAGHDSALSEEAVQLWRPLKRIRPSRASLRDFDFAKPGGDLGAEAEIVRGHGMTGARVYEYPGRYVEKGVGKTYADTRIEELQASHHVVQGQATLRGIASGCTFKLSGHPVESFNAEHLVISARHELTGGAYESGGGASESYLCRFEAMPAGDKGEIFRAPRRAAKPRIAGPQTARVVGASGEEIDTDEHGRVKLSFHWLPGTPSCWVRVGQAWVGDAFGAVSIPRIGDEVIVAFEGGDPDRPLVTGSVYNGASKPPYALPANKTVTTFKTSSTKGGGGFNELRFEDKKGEENIFLHAQKDFDFRAKNDAREWVGNERHATVGKSEFVAIGEDRHETVGKNLTRSVGAKEEAKVAGDSLVSVGGGQDVNVGKDAKLTAGMALHFNAGMDLLATGGMNVVVNAGMNAHVKAGMSAVIEAPLGITLACGGNFIALTPAGVAIQGSLVTINTGGAKGAGPGTKAAKAKKARKPKAPKEPKTAEPGAKPAAAPTVKATPSKFKLDSNPVSAALTAARDSAAPFAEVSG